MSEPKSYRDGAESDPADRTVLCAEIPCDVGDAVWTAAPDALASRLRAELAAQDLALATPCDVEVRRVAHAYPMYSTGFEAARTAVEEWALAQPRLLSLGRQGLFAHDNTHHTLAMAWAAAEALDVDGRVDPDRWASARDGFAGHVVED